MGQRSTVDIETVATEKVGGNIVDSAKLLYRNDGSFMKRYNLLRKSLDTEIALGN